MSGRELCRRQRDNSCSLARQLEWRCGYVNVAVSQSDGGVVSKEKKRVKLCQVGWGLYIRSLNKVSEWKSG